MKEASMAIFPSVDISQLPPYLLRDGKQTAALLLNSSTQPAMFWTFKGDKFVVVFRQRQQRDQFLRLNSKLE